jgi:HAD superfamily hydrolase (TIGR01490 family)
MRLAVYDLDGTLLDGDSHIALLTEFVVRSRAPIRSRSKVVAGAAQWALRLRDDDGTKTLAAEVLATLPPGRTDAWIHRFVCERVLPRVRPEMRRRLRVDRTAGFTTMLLSASLDAPVRIVARALGFDHFAATALARLDGVYLGRIEASPLRGAAKAEYLRRFARDHDADLSRARGYGDRGSDVPFLELVGEKFAVHPDRALRKIARARGWNIID